MRMILASLALSMASASAWAQCELVKFVPPVGEQFDSFGGSMEYDEGRFIFGHGAEDVGGMEAVGAVYVMEHTASGPTVKQRIDCPHPRALGFFGSPVLLDEDRLFIGAYGVGNGRIYMYEREGSDWAYSTMITASDGSPNDTFGGSFDVEGDRLVCGVSSGPNAPDGSFYIFEQIGGVWVERQKVLPSVPHPINYFGASVSLSGDRVLIGAPTISFAANSKYERAFIYEKGPADWVKTKTLQGGGPWPGNRYGNNVKLVGDTALVAAPMYHHQGPRVGAIHVYTDNNGAWDETDLLTSTHEKTGWYGGAIEFDGDRIAVGSTAFNLFWGGEPAVEVYVRDGDDWDLEMFLGDTGYSDGWGGGVKLLDDAIMIGSTTENGAGVMSGVAYLYSLPGEAVLVGGADESSVSAGATQSMLIGGCADYANLPYRIIGSVSGEGAGPVVNGQPLPLIFDAYTYLTLANPLATLVGGAGLLDGNGEGMAQLALPPISQPSLAGLTLHHAALVLSPGLDQVLAASEAIKVTLIP